MSIQYNQYLEKHKNGVKKAYDWIRNNLPELLVNSNIYDYDHQLVFSHDASKTEPDEYFAYDKYFYGGNRSYQVVQDFNHAWLMHIHRNPHHWQHWVLINDNPKEGEIVLDMPYNYIIEMICDWWSFSWNSGKLDEIFSWYNEHKDYMKLSDKTRKTVDSILEQIHNKLDQDNKEN